MQYSQPGFSNYGPTFAFNTPFQFNGYPEVVGEGNVTSVMSPDGSMQLLFLPTTQWWRPFPCNINNGNANNPNWNPTGAWFIRSVFSPLQTMPCQVQPLQTPNSGIAFQRTYSSDCCVSPPVCQEPNFELKFHNDICTSTSDIHYFYPSLRPCDWFKRTKECATVQVDVPMTNSVHYEVICQKPCNCTPMDETNITKAKCSSAKKSNTSFSDMSCETDKSDKEECCCYKEKAKKTRKDMKKNKAKKRNSNVVYECYNQKTSEKSMSTFIDQASGCAAEKGRETQTSPCGKGHETQTTPCEKGHETQTSPCGKGNETQTVIIGKVHKTQTPCDKGCKTQTSKKATKTKPSGNFEGFCESGCCSGSCSCHSDID